MFYASTTATAGFFAAHGLPAAALSVLDVDSAPASANDPYAAAKLGFSQAKTAVINAAVSAGADPTEAVTLAYHGSLVPPFCLASARGFFQNILTH